MLSRIFGNIAMVLAAALCGANVAAADAAGTNWPTRPVKLVVPYAAGGGTDVIARIISIHLTKVLGQPIVIDNRPGAATMIGSEAVARAAPDGYTVLVTTGTLAILPWLYAKMAFDPVRDLTAVSMFAGSPGVLLVHPSVPVKNLAELVSYAKARSGNLNYASSGNGGTGHLGMELLKQRTGIEVTHVPYRGGGPAMNAIIAGEVQVEIANVASAASFIKSGKVRAIAVTSVGRSDTLPELPAISESGLKDFDVTAWFGAFVPAGTPAPIVEKLSAALNEAVRQPEVQKALALQGVEPLGNSPAAFAAVVKSDLVRWRDVVTKAGIKPD